MPRLLLLSNRLGITIQRSGAEVCLAPSTGGLATALRVLHEHNDALWIGWPGDVSSLSEEQMAFVNTRLAELRAVKIHLDPAEVSQYYDGFSNNTLWPLLHHFLDKVQLDGRRDFESYEAVNERFAELAVAHYRPGDAVWVHDYHLMLAAEMLRKRLPDARIGFFLHTPFPTSDAFRVLPWRERLLRGLLGADLIGFQTASDRAHFAQTIACLLGVEPDSDTVAYDGRSVCLGVYPIGVDADVFSGLAGSAAVREEARRIREHAPDGRIVLGVDRLDYTKGILWRLAAMNRFFDRSPAHRRVRFVQVAVPTREHVTAYAQMSREVHEMVSRINGRHGSVDTVPIHFLHQSMPAERLAALYASADVMLVTPLRDGMNLVAKEYVATRADCTGALVLSEFAGAATELAESLIVNPYDIDSVAGAIERALVMPPEEQRLRMAALRRRVFENDIHRWMRSFLGDLGRTLDPPVSTARHGGVPPAAVAARFREAPRLTLLLDYDGTLVPLAPLPALAAPDAELLSLLRDLASRPDTSIHVVSGRKWQDLERWLGGLPIHLHGEHGLCSRVPGGAWTTLPVLPAAWKADVRSIFDDVSRRTPGCLIEEKTASVAWHYRLVEVELARARLCELGGRLSAVLRAYDLEALGGAKVLEVRRRGLNKGVVVERALVRAPEERAVIAIGDDVTDEDLFSALPPSALTIHVGCGASVAAFRLADPSAVRMFLRGFLARGLHPDARAAR
jgi:trehalose 6-phosphate synthase/phosphatase